MTAPRLALALPRPTWLLPAIVSTALAAGALLSAYPWLTAGLVVGALLMAALFLHPLVVLGFLLALGPVDLSFVTGGFKGLFVQLGGFDMNGIRLIGTVVGFSALLVVERRMARHALAWYGRWYVLFLVYAVATLTYSMAPLDGARFLFKLAFPFIVFIAVLSFARTPGQLRGLGDAVLIAAALIALLINPIYVLLGGYIIDSAGYFRAWGVGAHQNPFGFYLILMIVFAYARYAMRGEIRYLGLCGVLAIWVLLTVSRTAVAGAVVGIGGAALYMAIVGRNFRAVGVSLAVAAAVIAPVLPLVLERTFGYIPGIGELLSLARDPVQLYYAISWQGREIIWPIVFQAFLASPLYGLGIGSQTAVVANAIPPEWGAIVHNEYLRLLTDVGLVGGALYAIAIGAWAVAVARAGRSTDPLVREYAAPAIGALLVWIVVAGTENAFDYYAPFTQFVAFFCGATLAADRMGDGAVEAEPGGLAADPPPLRG